MDEVAELKAKLKKANANHEQMVSMWATQGEELEREAEDAKQALKDTFKELQAVRGQLRKVENRGDQAAATALVSGSLCVHASRLDKQNQ